MQASKKSPILPVRKLAWLAFPFGLGCLLTSAGLTTQVILILAPVLLLIAVVCTRLSVPWRIRPILACIGLALGLLWSTAYTVHTTQYTALADGETHTLQGIVLSSVTTSESKHYVEISLENGSHAMLYYYTDDELSIGDILTITGKTYLASESRQAIGIYLNITASSLTVEGQSTSPLLLPARFAALLQQQIQLLFTGDVAGLYCALLTGDKSSFSTSLSTALSRSGLSHIVAVSGLHISCLSGMLFLILRRRRSRLLAIPFLVFFTLMIGSVSAYRALLMAILLLLAPFFHRESDPLTSLGCAMLMILLRNPLCVTSTGFQLSFAAMLGLTVCAPKLYPMAEQFTRRLSDYSPLLRQLVLRLLQLVIVCVSASILTIPLVALHFGQISLISVLANLLITWTIPFLLLLGLLAVLGSLLYFPLGAAIAIPATFLSRLVLTIARALGSFTFSAISLESPYLLAWAIFTLIMLGALVWMLRWKLRPTLPICSILITLCLCLLLNRLAVDQTALTVDVLDVGQGQCILLISQGCTAAIDCGGSSYDSAGDILADELQALGFNQLDLLIITHLDSDHTNGLSELFARIDVINVILPDADETYTSTNYATLLSLCQTSGTSIVLLSEDLDLAFGAATVSIYPPMDASADNNSSLASLWQTEDFSMLVTGDMDSTGEWILIGLEDLPDIDLMIVGHHGSKYSTSTRLLSVVTPETAIISVGLYNSYNHPSDEVLERLSDLDISVYRTDENGTVTITVPN